MSRLPPHIEQTIDGVTVSGSGIQPIVRDGVTYTLSSEKRENAEGQICAQDFFVTASDAAGTVLWKTMYTTFSFDTDLEIDVQESFPVDFAFHENGIELTIKHENYTENDRVYRVMLEDGDIKLKSVE